MASPFGVLEFEGLDAMLKDVWGDDDTPLLREYVAEILDRGVALFEDKSCSMFL